MKRRILFILMLLICKDHFCQNNSKQEDWITIFVHGIVSMEGKLPINEIIDMFRDNLENTKYSKRVKINRLSKFNCMSQPKQGLGLLPIDGSTASYSSATLFADLYDEINSIYYPHQNNSYYTFGWSGLLSYLESYKEAIVFYKQLRNLIQDYKKSGKDPKIRILGYSRGGTLALNLAAVRQSEYPQDSFKIDEIILVGCPILRANACLVEDSMFKKILNVYSHGDRVQRLDFFAPRSFISRKKFHEPITLNTKSKLKQVGVTFYGRYLRNSKKVLPSNLRGVCEQSPGHIELWSFGWSLNMYRNRLIIHPLPVAVFTPYFSYISEYDNCPQNFNLDIYPEDNLSVFYENSKKDCLQADFISHDQLIDLQWYAFNNRPSEYKYTIS